MDSFKFKLYFLMFNMFDCFISGRATRIFPIPVSHVNKDWFSDAQNELHRALHLEHNENVAKNVIIFIGDGMGFPTIWASRLYAGQYHHGTSGDEHLLHFEKFPHVGITKLEENSRGTDISVNSSLSALSFDHNAWRLTYNVDYQIPDSAGTATAILSGVKVNAWTVGVNEKVSRSNCSNQAGNHVTSILQWSMDAGKATGVVTTTRVTHATPSSAYAHAAERFWESDRDMNRSRLHIDPTYNFGFGCKDIARQLVEDNPNINVVLGGGRRNFRSEEFLDEEYGTPSRRQDGRDLIKDWVDEKRARKVSHAYVWNKTALDAVDPLNTEYLLGLFEPSNMLYESERDPAVDPSLAELTAKAIHILKKRKQGFFLVVEGGKIDHAHHDGQARLALEETYHMDQAVKVALELTSVKDTLIVVVSDHSHSFANAGYTSRGLDILGLADNTHLSLPRDDLPYTTLMYLTGPGARYNNGTRHNLTEEDTTAASFQQQALVPMNQEAHGGEDVPVYAIGPMAHLFHATHEQHYIAHVMAYASCVGKNKNHCKWQRSMHSSLLEDPGNMAQCVTCTSALWVLIFVICTWRSRVAFDLF